MKRIFSIILAIILTLSLFTGCNNTGKDPVTEVTDENVKELFMPSFEAYFYFQGSAFYDAELIDPNTDEDIWNEMYEYLGGGTMCECYKIAGDITFDEIKNQVENYTFETYYFPSLWRSFFKEINGALYLGIGSFSDCWLFDINSIKLYKRDRNKYYITIDIYGNGVDIENIYKESYVFITSLRDDILYIEGLDEPIKRDDINSEDERKYVHLLSKIVD